VRVCEVCSGEGAPSRVPLGREAIADGDDRHTKQDMQAELLEQMYQSTELDELLKESEYTVRRRKECQQMVESLGRAQEIVGQVQ